MRATLFSIHFYSIVLCAMVLPGHLTAQTGSADLAAFARNLPVTIKKQVSRGQSNFMRQIANQIFQIAPDGKVTKQALKVHALRRTALNRSHYYQRMLNYDLNGDGSVSVDEIALQRPFLETKQRSQLELELVEHDADKNGDLSVAELKAAATKFISERTQMNPLFGSNEIMSFDYDRDGAVTLGEIAKVVAAINPDDLKNLPRSEPFPTRKSQACSAPLPEKGAETVFLGGNGGTALSTVAVAGPDTKTTIGIVHIKEGDAPLYIFAKAYYPIIWKFEGATERVEQLVIEARGKREMPQAGASGITAENVTFVPDGSCIKENMTKDNSLNRKRVAELGQKLGRPFDHVWIRFEIEGFQIPKGVEAAVAARLEQPYRQVTSFELGGKSYTLSRDGINLAGSTDMVDASEDPIKQTLRDMMRFYPKGIFPLDPKDVVALRPVEHYEILPQQAGLLQLVAEGKLKPMQGKYLIQKPIERFPGGLNRGSYVQFVLKDGVPVPKGNPGSGRLIDEKSGECLNCK